MIDWEIERIVNFEPGETNTWKNGYTDLGFHDREGRQYTLQHYQHFAGLIGEDDQLEWTIASWPVFSDIPNITADIKNPFFLDQLPNGSLILSSGGNKKVYNIDPHCLQAGLLLDGSEYGMKDMGNCVVDNEGFIWVNEIEGCRIWRFDLQGRPVLTLGNGEPGFQRNPVDFATVRFNWIYDLRRGSDGNIYVLDSKNFSLRMIELQEKMVFTLAGTGEGGYRDNCPASLATFGSDPEMYYDGPYSLSLDEDGNIYIGDTYNHVVRMIERKSGIITTIAGNPEIIPGRMNNPDETDPAKLNLSLISSMDYYNRRLFVPVWYPDRNSSDLIVLKKK